MPAPEALARFIARVEQNAHAEAIEEFYAPHASMRENQAAPRFGRDLLIAGKRRTLALARSVASSCARPVFVSADHVVIGWIFHFEWLDGTVTGTEQPAYQRWEGDRIADEQFFYDPAQRVPRNPAT